MASNDHRDECTRAKNADGSTVPLNKQVIDQSCIDCHKKRDKQAIDAGSFGPLSGDFGLNGFASGSGCFGLLVIEKEVKAPTPAPVPELGLDQAFGIGLAVLAGLFALRRVR